MPTHDKRENKAVSTDPKIIVALDFPGEAPALELVGQLDPGRCRLKVGKEMFTRLGPGFVARLAERGFQVFLDLKFHDIPNTVAAACEAALGLQPPPLVDRLRELLTSAETVREHLWRILLDWPRLLGEDPDGPAMAAAMAKKPPLECPSRYTRRGSTW